MSGLAKTSLACLALVACTTPVTPLPLGANLPRAIALTCYASDTKSVSLANCPGDGAIRALVGGGTRGTVSVAVPADYKWLDLDPAVPGYTGLRVPGLPGVMAVEGQTGHVYMILHVTRQIARLDASQLPAGKLTILDIASLPFDAKDIALVGGTLFVTDSAGGQVWTLATASFPGGAPQPIATGGTPNAFASAAGKLYIAHLHDRHVTVLDPTTRTVVKQIGYTFACQDGLDNDGDGKTDRDDSGCDLAKDVSEGDAGHAACSNGLDDDGDGKADYPADPGCSGFGDADEWTEAGTCRDGLDNDGNGQTDGADPLCAGKAIGTEHPVIAGAALPGSVALPCANTVDDDEDGLADLADPDCYNRLSPSESSADDAPSALIAASFAGDVVAVADKARRALLFIDTKTDTLILPALATPPPPLPQTPFARPAMIALAKGDLGLALPSLPGALTAVRLNDADAFAVTADGIGLLVVRLLVPAPVADAPDQKLLSIGYLAADTQSVTKSARPSLSLLGRGQELSPNAAPDRFANLGPLNTTDAGAYFGLTFTSQAFEHRTEVWKIVREGILPGGERSAGTWQAPDQLADGTVDFCRMGALPGDWLLVTQPACGNRPAVTVRYPISHVHADTLEIAANQGVLDVAVTADNQSSWAPALETPVGPPDLTCWDDRAVHYAVRARQWLVSGTQSGLFSQRGSIGDECAALPDAVAASARMAEPVAPGDPSGANFVPTSCPLGQLDPRLPATPYANPVFTAQMLPGCAKVQGAPARLLPSMRDTTWSYPVISGFVPRISDVGAAPVAAMSGPTLRQVYVVDEGLSALFVIDLPTGARVPADKPPLQ